MKKAGDILGEYMKNLESNIGKEYSSFFRSWNNIAGEDLGSHSRVKDIKNGVLIVETDHPGWIQMLHLRKRSILREVKSRYPELDIVEIRVIHGSERD